MLHHVEHAADDRLVLAQRVDARYRNVRRRQGRKDAKLAVDRMGAREQRARRFAAQHEGARVRVDPEGGVRLAAGEFRNGADRRVGRHTGAEPRIELRDVERTHGGALRRAGHPRLH